MKPRRGKRDYSALEYHCLVRATDGKRKLTTVVQGKDLARFQESFTTIMRVGAGRMPHCGSFFLSWQAAGEQVGEGGPMPEQLPPGADAAPARLPACPSDPAQFARHQT